MASKVRLPKEVADEVNGFRRGLSDWESALIFCLHDIAPQKMERGLKIIYDWVHSKGSFLLLMDALVNGFEIEQTPEDQVREYVARMRNRANLTADNSSTREYDQGVLIGAEIVANLMGVKLDEPDN